MARKKTEGKSVNTLDTEGLDPVLATLLSQNSFDGLGGLGAFIEERPFVSTGSLGLDLKLGGGLSRDRIYEYYGPSGSCKTSMALSTMSDYAKKFGYDRTLFILDLERTITAKFVRGYGLDPDKILVLRPKTAEDALNAISHCLNSGTCGFGILDSIDALESKEDRTKSYGEDSMMKLAKLLSQAMRDFSKASVDNDCGLILINQVRTGIKNFQAVETTSGGNSIPYYCSYRLRFSKKSKSENRPDALLIKSAVKKNKLYPLIEADTEFDFIPGEGIDKVGDFLDAGIQLGAIEQNGPYYSIIEDLEIINDKNEKELTKNLVVKVQGRKKFEEWLSLSKDNVNLFEKIVTDKFFSIAHTMIVQDSKEDHYDE